MPQFDIYLRNALQWGIRKVWAESADQALSEAQRMIEYDPLGFEMFYDGEFGDTVTHIRVCEPDHNDTLATWRSEDHGLHLFAADLLAAAETVVECWKDGDLADAMRRLAAVIGKTRQWDR